jgi:hypothetical protein
VTLRAWLRERTPAPPPRLAERIEETLGARCERDDAEATELCVSAAGELLGELLARRSAGRESALDLLTVDALVTYAFEAASREPSSLGSRATAAMVRLASAASV